MSAQAQCFVILNALPKRVERDEDNLPYSALTVCCTVVDSPTDTRRLEMSFYITDSKAQRPRHIASRPIGGFLSPSDQDLISGSCQNRGGAHLKLHRHLH